MSRLKTTKEERERWGRWPMFMFTSDTGLQDDVIGRLLSDADLAYALECKEVVQQAVIADLTSRLASSASAGMFTLTEQEWRCMKAALHLMRALAVVPMFSTDFNPEIYEKVHAKLAALADAEKEGK